MVGVVLGVLTWDRKSGPSFHMFSESLSEMPNRAGAVLTSASGDSCGVCEKEAKQPKSTKVLRTGKLSPRRGH
jgi:hypothetical protein